MNTIFLRGFLTLSLFLIHFDARAEDIRVSETRRFIFFAVLEGLYNDGLSDASVSAILGDDIKDNFVISCPICIPTMDAIYFYVDRPTFGGKNTTYRTFGPGLNREERQALAGTSEERRKQIQKLVARWIEARIASRNLPEAEEAKLRQNLRKYRERGSKALEILKNGGNGEMLQKAYANWDCCPSCNGATLHSSTEN